MNLVVDGSGTSHGVATGADLGLAEMNPRVMNAAVSGDLERDEKQLKSTWAELINCTETDDNSDGVEPSVRPSRKGALRFRRAIASVIGLAAVLLGAVLIYRTVTDKGELVIETEDPGVELVIRQGGRLVTIIGPDTEKHVELRPGAYEMALARDKLGLRLSADSFRLRRGERRVVTVYKEPDDPPSPAAAPPTAQLPLLAGTGPKAEPIPVPKKVDTAAVARPPEVTRSVALTEAEKSQDSVSPLKSGATSGDKSEQVRASWRRFSPLDEKVDRAVSAGVNFLKQRQRPDGSWPEVDNRLKTETTSLATLALLAAGEQPDTSPIRAALDCLRRFGPEILLNTQEIAIQTMVFAGAEPGRDRVLIVANVEWLERAQIPVRRFGVLARLVAPTYSEQDPLQPGDGLNTHYALLGLHAATEAGVRVRPDLWELARAYWEKSQKPNGGWAYTPDTANQTASMTCAGISSLVITGLRRFQGQEFLQGETIQNCGKGGINPRLQAGINWLAEHFQVSQNFGNGQQWKYYYLYGLERTGRLSGLRFFGRNDWYRLGAEELVHEQNKFGGYWTGALNESDRVLATSFALLFLAKGRAPVLINKLVHTPYGDWNNDVDDIRNIVNVVSHEWKSLLTWQVVDPSSRLIARLAPGSHPLFQRPSSSPVLSQRQTKPARGHRAGQFSHRRGVLRQQRVRRRVQTVDDGDLSRAGVSPAAPVRGPSSLACQASALARRLSSMGNRAWVSHGRHLLPRRPLVLLEPVRDITNKYGRDQGEKNRRKHHRLCHRPRDARRQAGGARQSQFQGGGAKTRRFRMAKLKHAGDWNCCPPGRPQPHGRPPQTPVQF